MLNRRTLLLSGSALLATAAAPARRRAARRCFRPPLGHQFHLGGKRYRYAGSNMWYAAFLGAEAGFGSRDRLRRELDALAALGISNLRILGSAELSPLKNSVSPAFRTAGRITTKPCCAASISRSPRWAGAA